MATKTPKKPPPPPQIRRSQRKRKQQRQQVLTNECQEVAKRWGIDPVTTCVLRNCAIHRNYHDLYKELDRLAFLPIVNREKHLEKKECSANECQNLRFALWPTTGKIRVKPVRILKHDVKNAFRAINGETLLKRIPTPPSTPPPPTPPPPQSQTKSPTRRCQGRKRAMPTTPHEKGVERKRRKESTPTRTLKKRERKKRMKSTPTGGRKKRERKKRRKSTPTPPSMERSGSKRYELRKIKRRDYSSCADERSGSKLYKLRKIKRRDYSSCADDSMDYVDEADGVDEEDGVDEADGVDEVDGVDGTPVMRTVTIGVNFWRGRSEEQVKALARLKLRIEEEIKRRQDLEKQLKGYVQSTEDKQRKLIAKFTYFAAKLNEQNNWVTEANVIMQAMQAKLQSKDAQLVSMQEEKEKHICIYTKTTFQAIKELKAQLESKDTQLVSMQDQFNTQERQLVQQLQEVKREYRNLLERMQCLIDVECSVGEC